MKFSEFGLSDALVRAVGSLGYDTPTPIQQQAIPIVMTGADLLAGAQTGTGKTAGFVLPTLHRLLTQPARKPRAVRALVLAPTRELAAQVEQSGKDYGQFAKIRSTVIFGGVSIRPQIAKLRSGVDVVVATPGRLLDHAQQGTLDLSGIEILILDEADRMLDMGFIHDIKRILKLLPKEAVDQQLILERAAKKCRITPSQIKDIQYLKRSIDARGSRPFIRLRTKIFTDSTPAPEASILSTFREVSDSPEILIIGAGPAGYFAALECLALGYKPVLLD